MTLPGALLREIDRHIGNGFSRSDFIRSAVRTHIAGLERPAQSLRDHSIINSRAARLNREAMDVLEYQIP